MTLRAAQASAAAAAAVAAGMSIAARGGASRSWRCGLTTRVRWISRAGPSTRWWTPLDCAVTRTRLRCCERCNACAARVQRIKKQKTAETTIKDPSSSSAAAAAAATAATAGAGAGRLAMMIRMMTVDGCSCWSTVAARHTGEDQNKFSPFLSPYGAFPPSHPLPFFIRGLWENERFGIPRSIVAAFTSSPYIGPRACSNRRHTPRASARACHVRDTTTTNDNDNEHIVSTKTHRIYTNTSYCFCVDYVSERLMGTNAV